MEVKVCDACLDNLAEELFRLLVMGNANTRTLIVGEPRAHAGRKSIYLVWSEIVEAVYFAAVLVFDGNTGATTALRMGVNDDVIQEVIETLVVFLLKALVQFFTKEMAFMHELRLTSLILLLKTCVSSRRHSDAAPKSTR